MKKEEFRIEENINLVKAVQNKLPFLSNYQIEKILQNKDIQVNNKRVKEDKKLLVGDYVEVYFDIEEKPWFEEVFCDNNVLMVNKKGGIEIISETDRDLLSILQKKYGDVRAVHRIDRNTEGLVIFARNDIAERELLKSFKDKTVTKKYLLECEGKVDVTKIKPRLFLKKLSNVSKVIISEVKTSGYETIKTNFTFVSYNGKTTLLEAELLTGKTHQIRAHISYYGHSIVGDGKYGIGDKKMHLTSYFIKFHLKDNSPLNYLNNMHFEITPSWL